MPELNPLSNEQIFLKKIAENTGSDYNTGDVSEINPLTIDQILLKEIAANTAGQSGDITELEEKVAANASAIEATQDMISDAYDSTHTYNVGDYCIYENALYKCNTDIATGEAFTPAKWDVTTVAGELTEKTIKQLSVSLTIQAQVLTGGVALLLDPTRIIGIVLRKNDNVFAKPIIYSVYDTGFLEAQVVDNTPPGVDRTYNFYINYI